MKVERKKLTLFVSLVLLITVIVISTLPYIWHNIVKGLDLQGGFEVLYEADQGQRVDTHTMHDAASAINRRINVLGVSEPDITIEPPRRIRVQLAGVKDQVKARALLGRQANLTFRDPTGKQVLLSGAELASNGARVDYNNSNQPIVTLKLKDAAKFRDITSRYLGQPMPIYLDETLLSSPTIRAVIPDGEPMIEGQRSMEEARELADLLNAGASPLKLHEVQSFAVDASLGASSLRDSYMAGALALFAIFIFVIGYYRLPGWIAAFTLFAYAYLILLVFMLLHVTLTLPGIAAFILGMGIAVDANIIMYERIREELRAGKSIAAAARSGSRISFRTIFDAHVTAIIASIALFYFGTAGVKGFAVSLLVGILGSFVTAVALSRVMLTLLIRSNLVKNHGLFRVREDEISDL